MYREGRGISRPFRAKSGKLRRNISARSKELVGAWAPRAPRITYMCLKMIHISLSLAASWCYEAKRIYILRCHCWRCYTMLHSTEENKHSLTSRIRADWRDFLPRARRSYSPMYFAPRCAVCHQAGVPSMNFGPQPTRAEVNLSN